MNQSLEMTQNLPQMADYLRILPEIVLSLFGMAIMIVDPLLDERRSHKTLGAIGLLGALTAVAATFCQAQHFGTAFWSMVRVSAGLKLFLKIILITTDTHATCWIKSVNNARL